MCLAFRQSYHQATGRRQNSFSPACWLVAGKNAARAGKSNGMFVERSIAADPCASGWTAIAPKSCQHSRASEARRSISSSEYVYRCLERELLS